MEKIIDVPIVTENLTFIGRKDQLDLEAISIFLATGSFLNDTTYFKGLKSLKPGHRYVVDTSGNYTIQQRWFDWNKQVSITNMNDAVDALHELLLSEIDLSSKYLVPLSGGLDTRCLAAALSSRDTKSFSYSYTNGYKEHSIGAKIARSKSFSHRNFVIDNEYFWEDFEKILEISNGEVNPFFGRQYSMKNFLSENKNRRLLLGHGGDILFSNRGIRNDHGYEGLALLVVEDMLEKGGLKLAEDFWQLHGLQGTFKEYFLSVVEENLRSYNILDSNKLLRAFKIENRLNRFTMPTVKFYGDIDKVLPFISCKAIRLTVDIEERLLSGRKIQIEYLKRQNPDLAKIVWQEHRPFNLYTYRLDRPPINIAYRMYDYARRKSCNEYIQRNWELQMGNTNALKILRDYFDANASELISKELSSKYIDLFTLDRNQYAHCLGVLLSLMSRRI